jgi:hypothetical protein
MRVLAMLLVVAGCREPAAPIPPAQSEFPALVLRSRIDACEDPLLAEADLASGDRMHIPSLSHGCFAVLVHIEVPSYLSVRSFGLSFDDQLFHELAFEDDPGVWQHTLVVGPAAAGEHRLSIVAEVGPKHFGVFRYSAYTLRLRRSVPIHLGKGDPPIVAVKLDEVGSVTTPVEERLRLSAHVSARSALLPRSEAPIVGDGPPMSVADARREAIALHAYVIRAIRRARAVRDAVWYWCLYEKNNAIASLRRELVHAEELSRAASLLARIRRLATEAEYCM